MGQQDGANALVYKEVVEKGVFEKQPNEEKEHAPHEVYSVEIDGFLIPGFCNLCFFQFIDFVKDTV